MPSSNGIFSNLFRSKSITPERAYAFGMVVLQALILANDNKQFDAVIALLTAALEDLKREISNVDVNIGSQKTETQTVDGFMAGMSLYMSENEPFIARQLGGRKSAGYQALYPFGKSEYARATKTEMPTLTLRLKTVSTKYAGQLDADIFAALQSFDADYAKCYTAQQTQIRTVSADRTERKSAFVNVQLVLTHTVHTVGATYPGNEDKCASFFPFAMLYPHPKNETATLRGTLAAGETRLLTNVTFTKKVEFHLKNTGDNASFAFWAGNAPNAPMPDDAVVVNANGADVLVKAATLPDLVNNTYYFVKNLNATNTCSYEVALTGLRKPLQELEAERAKKKKAGKKKGLEIRVS